MDISSSKKPDFPFSQSWEKKRKSPWVNSWKYLAANTVKVVISILRRFYYSLHKFKLRLAVFIFWVCPILFLLWPYSNIKCCFCSWHNFFLFKSSASGNCLYSSKSLSLFGDESVKKDLRVLSSSELFLCKNYYWEHPVLLNFREKYNIPSSWAAKSLFLLSTLHFDLTLCEIVKIEAIKNCVDKSWTSFLCIQVVSSVRNRSVSSLTKSSFEIYLTVIYVKIIKVIHAMGKAITSRPNITILFCRYHKIAWKGKQ